MECTKQFDINYKQLLNSVLKAKVGLKSNIILVFSKLGIFVGSVFNFVEKMIELSVIMLLIIQCNI